ncbi:MOSC domain-containing protein [Pseudooctadecabacter sp.]|uniref:MOSC domain-containing protein n=1 Tax=Pseudooctadecabacter sp. TaxID=1966338 RepID=UPI0035C817DB
MLATHAGAGRVDWIGLRPARLEPLTSVEAAELFDDGLVGDHARPGKRALTLIQAEHLPVIAKLARLNSVAPDRLRRNLVISGITLTALRNHPVQIGGAVVEFTTVCAPCSRMEKALGAGGYNAMRGHGGWCATVLEPGPIRVGDRVMQAG